MGTVITILFVLNAIFLIGVVLIQQPKTAGGLFSGTGQSLLGTSGKTFWTKLTTVAAGIFMALCLLMAALPRFQGDSGSLADTLVKQQQAAAQAQQAAPPPAAPNAPNPQTKPAAQKAPAAPQKP